MTMTSKASLTMARKLLVGVVGLLAVAPLSAQIGPQGSSVVEVGLALRQLDGVKRVLMIGAHPDDEDSSLLAALARGMGVETAYLSLTRGDGGQNIIGPELGEGLGIIRTGELEAARRLDGGRQFFTRAFDYGFSKSAEEAFAHWPREELLEDVVSVIRTYRPQVIVSVFSGTPRDGHGQHQAAGILTNEAFDAAADPTRFPDLQGVATEPWAVDKLYQSARFRGPGSRPSSGSGAAPLTVQTGTFDSLLGRSYHQLAMESRSQHRSQEMGAAQVLGDRNTGIQLVQSRVGGIENDQGIFAGVDTTLAGLVDGLPVEAAPAIWRSIETYRGAIEEAAASLSAVYPGRAAGPLARAYLSLEFTFGLIQGLGDSAGPLAEALAVRAGLVRSALLSAASIVIDVRAGDDLVVAGEDVSLDVQLWNGGPFRIEGAGLRTVGGTQDVGLPAEFLGTAGQTLRSQTLEPGEIARWSYRVRLRPSLVSSRLYYLGDPRDGDMYDWSSDPGSQGLPRNARPLLRAVGEFSIHIPGLDGPVNVVWGEDAEYVGVNRAVGEFREPVLATPAISVAIEPGVMAWPEGSLESRPVTVMLQSESNSGSVGDLSFEVPEGWEVTPSSLPFNLSGEGASRGFTFSVRPLGPVDAGEHVFRAVATREDGTRFDEQVDIIDYPHVERTLYFSPAEVRAQVFPVQMREGIRVGYVMGSGDDGLEALRQLGATVEEVGPARIREGNFSGYDVLVLGIRVYETRPDVAAVNGQILAFAEAGGTVIVQYNKYEYPRGDFAPYPVSMGVGRGAPRVTDENSPFTLLDRESPVLSSPNRISETDFEGWVQERGLYFLAEWDERFTPVLEFNDPGEEPTRGSLLVAPVGEGLYAYVALAFFRQLPAGVPGAYRLFANLVSLTAEDWNAYYTPR
jgi:LmbE family N-acetylglucosaminyl deacetylase